MEDHRVQPVLLCGPLLTPGLSVALYFLFHSIHSFILNSKSIYPPYLYLKQIQPSLDNTGSGLIYPNNTSGVYFI